MDIAKFLSDLKAASLEEFSRKKYILSFREFLQLFAAAPANLSRTAPQYAADAFRYFGTEQVHGLGGAHATRYQLFDAAFDAGQRPVFGQEAVTQDIAARLEAFAAAGQADRFLMLHGPNGSSKTSIIDCILRAMEHYSHQPEGALYTLNWVFIDRDESGKMGFGRSGAGAADASESLAHVDGQEMSCRIPCEMHDNPLFLVPQEQRGALLDALAAESPDPAAGRLRALLLRRNDICPKCRQIYNTLLAAYAGDWQRVVRHVQVERFFISRRYREGAVSIQPQGIIDAGVEPYLPERGSALPLILQGLQLFAPSGDLIDANRGMVEYNDFLKRPLEANKYLLTTAERGTASLPRFEAHLDLVIVATANEQQLTAFKTHPDFNSFRGRVELVPCPYLLEYRKEARIYADYLGRAVRGRHVAPHVAECAALWAVLTRLRKPDTEDLEGPLASALGKLKPLDKALLYDAGRLPPGLNEQERKELAAAAPELAQQFRERALEFEGGVWAAYEGAFGASPRELQLVLADAAANPSRKCLTPLGVFEQLEDLVQQTSVYDFLRLEPEDDYWKPAEFIATVREEHYFRTAWREAAAAAGLIAEAEYERLLRDYFTHVRAWAAGDKVKNPTSGRWEPPGEEVMHSVEKRLPLDGSPESFRKGLVSRAAAWSLDHPGERIDPQVVFRDLFDQLQQSFYAENRKTIKGVLQALLRLGTDDEAMLAPEQKAKSEQAMKALLEMGYCPECAKEMTSFVLRRIEKDENKEE